MKITKISLSLLSLLSSPLYTLYLQKFEKSGKKLETGKLKIETSREQEIEERESREFWKIMAQTKIDVAKLQFDDEGVDTEVRLSLSLFF